MAVWMGNVTVCSEKFGVVVLESAIKAYRWTEMPSEMPVGITTDREAG
jgi:hypothetical protein